MKNYIIILFFSFSLSSRCVLICIQPKKIKKTKNTQNNIIKSDNLSFTFPPIILLRMYINY